MSSVAVVVGVLCRSGISVDPDNAGEQVTDTVLFTAIVPFVHWEHARLSVVVCVLVLEVAHIFLGTVGELWLLIYLYVCRLARDSRFMAIAEAMRWLHVCQGSAPSRCEGLRQVAALLM